MTIPKVVTIKGEKWKIKFKDDLKDDAGNALYGKCVFDCRTIYLETKMPDELLSEVFLHEFFHACFHELHVDLDPEINEIICDGLGYIANKTFEWKAKKQKPCK